MLSALNGPYTFELVTNDAVNACNAHEDVPNNDPVISASLAVKSPIKLADPVTNTDPVNW